jgi:hypothetical protein
MRKILFIAICFIAFNAQAQNVGIGTDTPLQKLDVRGNQYIRDSLGLGVPLPHAQLHFANNGGKKIILYEDGNNANQYYGMAIDPSTLRFQTSNAMSFNVGISANASIEAIKINYTGVGIGNSAPTSPLQFANTFSKKKLVLYDTSNNANQFYGFGTTQGILNYQSQGDHAFYAGASPALSKELVRISSTGNVGIGVSDPHAQIHLANSSGRKIILYEDANNEHQYYGIAVDNSALRFQTNNNFVFYDGTSATTSNELFRINGTGNVGIGVSSPHAPLHLANSTGRKIILYEDANDDHNYYGIGMDPSTLRFQTKGNFAFYKGTSSSSSAELFRISSNGNVGIGNNNPQQKLDVNGNIAAAGTIITQDVSANGNITAANISATNSIASYDISATRNISAFGNVSATGNISAAGNFMVGLEYKSSDFTADGSTTTLFTCSCSAGKKVISGGGGHRNFDGTTRDINVNFSGPTDDGSAWKMIVYNTSPSPRLVRAWAICAKMQ